MVQFSIVGSGFNSTVDKVFFFRWVLAGVEFYRPWSFLVHWCLIPMIFLMTSLASFFYFVANVGFVYGSFAFVDVDGGCSL